MWSNLPFTLWKMQHWYATWLFVLKSTTVTSEDLFIYEERSVVSEFIFLTNLLLL